jgi:RNA polymerase sigma-70 factor, ECF subfamily
MDKNQIIALAQKVQSGDQSAFSDLYDEFSPRLYSYIRIKVGTDQEAEDILQEVFLKAWTGIKKLDLSNLNLSAWLYKVTGNTINDYYRKKYRQPQQVSIDEAAELAGTDSPSLNTGHQLEKRVVERLMDELPSHYKEVIELRYFQDFSVADTAQIMGKNSVTVRVWQHRALARLKELFQNHGQ